MDLPVRNKRGHAAEKASLENCFTALAKGQRRPADGPKPVYIRLFFPESMFTGENAGYPAFARVMDRVFNNREKGSRRGYDLGGYRVLAAGRAEARHGEMLPYIDVFPERLNPHKNISGPMRIFYLQAQDVLSGISAHSALLMNNLVDHPVFREMAFAAGVVEIRSAAADKQSGTKDKYAVNFLQLGW